MPGDSHETVWNLTPHTQAKHELLRNYLGAWFPILSSKSGRIVVLDGFAGPGVYSGGEDGSPRIVLSTLIDHQHASRMSECEFILVFNEQDSSRYEELERQVERLRQEYDGWPGNVKVETLNESFPKLAEEILEDLEGKQLAPMFAFLDPFGYRDVPLDLIRRLLAFRHCELFIYFDFNSVNRFSTSGVVDEHFEALFGTDEFMEAPSEGADRKRFLHDLYERQLHEYGGFEYVCSFEMVNAQGHTGNYLFFCTRNVAGLDKMKQAMWKVAPAGDYRFDDRNVGQQGFFDEDVDTDELRKRLIDQFSGQTVPVERLREFTIIDTPFASNHLKRRTLTPMQQEGLIESPNQRMKGTFPDGTLVHFK